MKKLFIDSNIYLGFYNSIQPEFKKLLSALIEIKDKIFITHQIIDEINRNKLNIFRVSVDNYIKQSIFSTTHLPEHLETDGNNRISAWNTKRKQLEGAAFKLNKELSDIINDTLETISKSQDKVSIELQKIFTTPLKVSGETLKKANMRKTIGNPPGKNNNPLGDQLNWVQILENCKNTTHIWIVSKDKDYFVEYSNRLFLNSLLYKEITGINSKIEIKVFNKLSDALRDFNNHQKIESLPSNDELEKISTEEPPVSILVVPHHGSHNRLKFYGGGHAVPLLCPNCNSENWSFNGGYRPSQFGGVTYQYECKTCGYLFDTGDYGDNEILS